MPTPGPTWSKAVATVCLRSCLAPRQQQRDDLKKVRQRWTEAAKAEQEANALETITTPEQRFKALRKPWRQLREKEQGIRNDPAERLRLQQEMFFALLLEALGYPYAPKAELVLMGGEPCQVPVLGLPD